jgi:hypothetical protein
MGSLFKCCLFSLHRVSTFHIFETAEVAFWAFPTLHFHVGFLVYVGMVLVPVPDDNPFQQLVKDGIAVDEDNWAALVSVVMDIL